MNDLASHTVSLVNYYLFIKLTMHYYWLIGRVQESFINIFNEKHAKQSLVLSGHSFLPGFYIVLCHLFNTAQQLSRSLCWLEVIPEQRTLFVLRTRSIVRTQWRSRERRCNWVGCGWGLGKASTSASELEFAGLEWSDTAFETQRSRHWTRRIMDNVQPKASLASYFQRTISWAAAAFFSETICDAPCARTVV